MNKQEYLSALEKEINRLPKVELAKVLEYYSEYFDEAGIENEQSVIEELGAPKMIASQVLTETAMKSMEEPVKSVKGGLNTIWIVILAIFASPIAFPLILAGVVVVIALAFTALMIVLSFIVAAVALFFGGIVSIGSGFVLLFSQFGSGIMVMGTGALSLGFGIFIAFASMHVGTWMFAQIVRLVKKVTKRRMVK